MGVTEKWQALGTPCLLLEQQKLTHNIHQMAHRAERLAVPLRPHVKTHKSLDVLNCVVAAGGTVGITVSTLSEAAYFFAAGHRDIFYAVGLTPNKIPEVSRLINAGCHLSVTTDSVDMAALLAQRAAGLGVTLDIVIELDVDGQRAGIAPVSAALTELAIAIHESPHLQLLGVMAHAGGSYQCASVDEIRSLAARERDLTRGSAEQLRAAGLPCERVSVGSTPTALTADDLTGITEFRPGVYTFMDLYMAGLGVATVEQIAISVATTVIGHQRAKGWVLIDAGWMALSRDLGRPPGAADLGYGMVCDAAGRPIDDLMVAYANQEHGIITSRDPNARFDVSRFPVGSLLRILPNHACATAAQHSAYWVIDNDQVQRWERSAGW